MALLDRFKSKLSSAITETSEAPEEAPEELAEDDDKGWYVMVSVLAVMIFCQPVIVMQMTMLVSR
jgi:hypothetical protein